MATTATVPSAMDMDAEKELFVNIARYKHLTIHTITPKMIVDYEYDQTFTEVLEPHTGNTCMHLMVQSWFRHQSGVDENTTSTNIRPILNAMISRGADKDAQNLKGETALHLAVQMLEHEVDAGGAIVSCIPAVIGSSITSGLQLHNWEECCKLCGRRDAVLRTLFAYRTLNPNLQDIHGQTPLHVAMGLSYEADVWLRATNELDRITRKQYDDEEEEEGNHGDYGDDAQQLSDLLDDMIPQFSERTLLYNTIHGNYDLSIQDDNGNTPYMVACGSRINTHTHAFILDSIGLTSNGYQTPYGRNPLTRKLVNVQNKEGDTLFTLLCKNSQFTGNKIAILNDILSMFSSVMLSPELDVEDESEVDNDISVDHVDCNILNKDGRSLVYYAIVLQLRYTAYANLLPRGENIRLGVDNDEEYDSLYIRAPVALRYQLVPGLCY